MIRSSAPDEMDYFHVILIGQRMDGIAIARNDLTVHFNGDSTSAQAKVRNQVGNGRTITNLLDLAVE